MHSRESTASEVHLNGHTIDFVHRLEREQHLKQHNKKNNRKVLLSRFYLNFMSSLLTRA